MVSTLAQQSAKRAVEELAANPDKIAERFVEFGPEEQQLLLREMGKRIAKLGEVERIWKSLDIPTADLQELVRRSTLPNQSGDGDTHEDAKREQIKGSWLWLDFHRESDEAWDAWQRTDDVDLFEDHWFDHDLFAQCPDAPLTLCSCHPTTVEQSLVPASKTVHLRISLQQEFRLSSFFTVSPYSLAYLHRCMTGAAVVGIQRLNIPETRVIHALTSQTIKITRSYMA
ncbi:hypothetical protein Vi05172_g13330 [Venturia inaequalis]|nr:hypothetical protein Vi05172_g13330 [Venturia inaequalis]